MSYRVICSQDDCGYEGLFTDPQHVVDFIRNHEHYMGIQEI